MHYNAYNYDQMESIYAKIYEQSLVFKHYHQRAFVELFSSLHNNLKNLAPIMDEDLNSFNTHEVEQHLSRIKNYVNNIMPTSSFLS